MKYFNNNPIVNVVILLFGLVGNNCYELYKDPHFRPGRTGFVHLFEWKFSDIAEECERFLAPNGFAAVQTSPVHENLIILLENGGRPWYERYQPVSYRLLSRSGNEKDFLQMSRRCNAVGVRIIVDVILNHMTQDLASATGTGDSRPDTFARLYPDVPYTSANFNPTCRISDYSSKENVKNCELDGLHDLDQKQAYVKDILLNFLNHLVDLGVAGFRIDAAKHMWIEDLAAIYANIKNLNIRFGFKPKSRPLILQEVGGLWMNEYEQLGYVTEFQNGIWLSKAMLREIPLSSLTPYGSDSFVKSQNMMPSSAALVFIDNHDSQRNPEPYSKLLTYKSPKLYKMAVAFMYAYTYGLPRIMSSFAFETFQQGPPENAKQEIVGRTINKDGSCGGGWVCEHRWTAIRAIVGFRNVVDGTDVQNWYTNAEHPGHVAFCRGNKGFIAFNADTVDFAANIQTCLPAGQYCDVIAGYNKLTRKCEGKVIDVNGQGMALIFVPINAVDGVVAYHVRAEMSCIFDYYDYFY